MGRSTIGNQNLHFFTSQINPRSTLGKDSLVPLMHCNLNDLALNWEVKVKYPILEFPTKMHL